MVTLYESLQRTGLGLVERSQMIKQSIISGEEVGATIYLTISIFVIMKFIVIMITD